MKKLKDFINSLIAIWPLVYIVETHIVGVLVFGNMFIDFSSPTIDIVLHYIGIILAIAFCDIVLLLPSLTFISMGVFPSLGMLFSVPIYLLMNLFFLLGSEYTRITSISLWILGDFSYLYSCYTSRVLKL
jgi:hypothetical protein